MTCPVSQRVSDSQLKNQECLEICCNWLQTQDIAIIPDKLEFHVLYLIGQNDPLY